MYKFRGQEREHEDPDRDKDDDYFPNVPKVGSRTLTRGLDSQAAAPLDTQGAASSDAWLAAQPIGGVRRATITSAPSADAGASRFGDLTRLRATLEKLAGSGVPLPETTSSKYSALLGADLSSVRIHATGEASDVTAAMGARALTHGAHIAFAPGAYDAATADHDHVLAHELVHVVQNQRSGGPAMQLAARLDVGPSGSAIESEAEAGAQALTSGRAFAVTARSSLPGISLFGDPGPAPTATPPANATPPPAAGAPPATATPATAPPPAAGAPPATATPAPSGTTAPPANGAPPATATPTATGAPTTGAPPATATPAPAGDKPGAATPAPVAPGAALDSKIAAILEQRADPAAKSSYGATLGSIMTLRLTATQYSFVNSNIGHTLLQMVWPSDALGDHVGQIGKLNAYRGNDPDGGTSFWGGVQRSIEGLRGILHMLGDLAAALSAIAGVVAIAAAAVGAVCAISIIGLAGPAEVAAGIAVIADAIATAAALVKIAADFIDLLLGVLQMIILVFRARAAKGDPAQRARFAQLLHKEAGDFAGNVVGIVVQVGVLLATAGAGAGGAKGLSKMAAKDVGHEFEKLLPKEALKSLKNDLPAGLKIIKRGLADTKAGAKIGAKAGVRAAALGADEEVAKLSVLLRNAKGKAIKVRGGGKARQLVEFTLDKQRRGALTILNTGKVNYVGIKNVGAIAAAGQTTQFIVDTKAPSGPGGPGGDGPRMRAPGTPVAGSLGTVQMWPSQIEAFKTEKNLLGNVKEHVEEQYENAKTQAGPELAAAFEEKIKAAIEKRNAAKEEAAAVKGDAADSKAQSDKGATTAGQGADTKKKADANNTALKAKTDTAGGKAETLKTPPAKDGIGSWLYNHSIGYLGQAIGWVQDKIKNNLGKFLFYLAGYDSAELDMAGIEGDMRTSAQNDTHAGDAAAQVDTAVDPVQKAVVDMQADKTTSQQQAIQGMADSKNFIEALEEADKTLGEAIETGETYMTAAAPLLQHEVETESAGKPIDGAYVQPLLAYADAVASSIDAENDAPAIAAQANAKFTALAADLPGIDIGPAQTVIGKAAADYATGHAALVANGHAAAAKAKAAISAFVGTTDFDGCNQNALALDHLADEMLAASDALGDKMVATINNLIDQYNQAIAAAMAGQTQPGPVPSVVPPGAVTPNTPPGTPAPTGGSHRLTGSHDRLAGDFTPAPAAGASANQPAPPPPASGAGAGLSIKSTVTAPAAGGGGPDRKIVGIGEEVTFSSGSGESGTWTASGGTPTNGTGSSLVWNAPGTAGQFTINLKVGDKETTTAISVILPTSVKFTKVSDYGPGADWMIGAGMELDMEIQPLNVSFTKITIREQPGGASGLSGYFTSGHGDISHHPSPGPTLIRNNNKTGSYDDAHLMDAEGDLWPRPLKVGSMTFQIPYLYTAGSVTDASFSIVAQTMGIVDSKGTVTVTKGAASTSRSPVGKPPPGAIPKPGGSAGGQHGGRHTPTMAIAREATTSSTPSHVPDVVSSTLASAQGAPLQNPELWSERVGADVSHARVVTGEGAAEAAAAIDARAFTVGDRVFMGAGHDASTDGGGLLSHELTHVAQQAGASAPSSWSSLSVLDHGDHRELAARANAGPQTTSDVAIARDPDPATKGSWDPPHLFEGDGLVSANDRHNARCNLQCLQLTFKEMQDAGPMIQLLQGQIAAKLAALIDDATPLTAAEATDLGGLGMAALGGYRVAMQQMRDTLQRSLSAATKPEGVDGMSDQGAEVLRKAFHKDESTLKKAKELNESIHKVAEKLNTMIGWAQKALGAIAEVEKWKEFAEKLEGLHEFGEHALQVHEILSNVANMAYALAASGDSSLTNAQQGAQGVSAGVSAVSAILAAGSMIGLGCASALGSVWTSMVVPETEMAIKGLEKLDAMGEDGAHENMREAFEEAVKNGSGPPILSKVDLGAGWFAGGAAAGQATLNYMWAAWQGAAADAAPPEVTKFFYDNKSKMNAEHSDSEQLDTEWHAFKANEIKNLKAWVMSHRAEVWAMFYGSLPHPAAVGGGEGDGGDVARAADGGGVQPAAEGLVTAAAGSTSAALPGALRPRLERAAGADLSGVRVHTGPESAAAASAVGAKAYAMGQDIHFAQGQYDPASAAGQRLIAHEVAHTVQQRGGSAEPRYKLEVSAPGDAIEVEADRFAEAAIGRGEQQAISAQGMAIARDGDEPVKLDQKAYLAKYTDQIVTEIAAQMATISVDTQSSFATWKDAQAFIGAVTTAMTANHAAFISSLSVLCAESPNAGIDRGRGADADGKSDDKFQPAVATEIRNILARRLQESVGRVMPRYAQATNQQYLAQVAATLGPVANPGPAITSPADPLAADIIASAPIDKCVIPALIGKVRIDLKNYEVAHPDEKPAQKPRKVDYTFEATEKSSQSEGKHCWVRVSSVCVPPVTVEDVALSLFGGSEFASFIVAAPPLYGFVHPEKLLRYEDWKKLPGNDGSTDPNSDNYDPAKADPAAQVLASQGADQAALSQAAKYPGTGQDNKAVAQRMRTMIVMLDGMIADAGGMPALDKGALTAARARLEERQKKVLSTDVKAGAAPGNEWDGQSAEQLGVLQACATGIHTAGSNWTALTAGGGGSKSPASFVADPVNRLGKAYVDAAAVSDLIDTARQRLALATSALQVYPIDVMEGLLSYVRQLIESVQNSNSSSEAQISSKANNSDLGKKEEEMRAQLAKLRDTVLTSPGAAAVELKKIEEDIKKLQDDATVLALVAQVGDLQKLLDSLHSTLGTRVWARLNPWSKETRNKNQMYDDAKYQLYAFRDALVDKVVTPARAGDTAKAHEGLIAVQNEYKTCFDDVAKLIETQESREKWIKIGVMIGVGIMSAGFADAVAVAGAEAWGLEGAGLAALKTGAEAAVFTSLTQTTLEKDPTIQGVIADFVKNAVTFGLVGKAMESYKLALPAFAATKTGMGAGIAGMFVAHCSAGLAAADAKKYLETGKHLTEEEAKDSIEEGVLVTIGTVIGERITHHFLEGVHLTNHDLQGKVKHIDEMRETTKQAAAVLSTKGAKVAQADLALKAEATTIKAEQDTLAELDEISKDPAKAKAAGISDADVKTIQAAKGQADAAEAANKLQQLTAGLKDLGGGTMSCQGEDRFNQLVDGQRKAGSTVDVTDDKATGQKVAVIRTKDGQTLRVVDDTTGGGVTAKADPKPVGDAEAKGTAAAIEARAKEKTYTDQKTSLLGSLKKNGETFQLDGTTPSLAEVTQRMRALGWQTMEINDGKEVVLPSGQKSRLRTARFEAHPEEGSGKPPYEDGVKTVTVTETAPPDNKNQAPIDPIKYSEALKAIETGKVPNCTDLPQSAGNLEGTVKLEKLSRDAFLQSDAEGQKLLQDFYKMVRGRLRNFEDPNKAELTDLNGMLQDVMDARDAKGKPIFMMKGPPITKVEADEFGGLYRGVNYEALAGNKCITQDYYAKLLAHPDHDPAWKLPAKVSEIQYGPHAGKIAQLMSKVPPDVNLHLDGGAPIGRADAPGWWGSGSDPGVPSPAPAEMSAQDYASAVAAVNLAGGGVLFRLESAQVTGGGKDMANNPMVARRPTTFDALWQTQFNPNPDALAAFGKTTPSPADVKVKAVREVIMPTVAIGQSSTRILLK